MYENAQKLYYSNDVLFIDDVCIGEQRNGESFVFKDLVQKCRENNRCGLILASQLPPVNWLQHMGGSKEAADALKIQICSSNVYNEMPFENRLIELLTAYDDALTARRSETLIRQAKLKSKMSFDDLTLSSERGFTPDTKKYIASIIWTYPGKVSNITVLGASSSGKNSLLCGIGYHCIN